MAANDVRDKDALERFWEGKTCHLGENVITQQHWVNVGDLDSFSLTLLLTVNEMLFLKFEWRCLVSDTPKGTTVEKNKYQVTVYRASMRKIKGFNDEWSALKVISGLLPMKIPEINREYCVLDFLASVSKVRFLMDKGSRFYFVNTFSKLHEPIDLESTEQEEQKENDVNFVRKEETERRRRAFYETNY